jgi:hypothetical protein
MWADYVVRRTGVGKGETAAMTSGRSREEPLLRGAAPEGSSDCYGKCPATSCQRGRGDYIAASPYLFDRAVAPGMARIWRISILVHGVWC